LATPKIPGPPTSYKGRYIGIFVLVAAQVLVGFIHLVFGVWMLAASHTAPFKGMLGTSVGPDIYAIYTVIFSLLTLVFAWAVWTQKWWGWVGTVAVAAFVILADFLALLDLPSVPGIPKFAGFGEIAYSMAVLLCLTQSRIRAAYGINLKRQHACERLV
jgi:hypothetical protein